VESFKRHVRIFDSISTLIEHGKLADAIVLKNRFSQDDTLVDIGGVEYLARLLHDAPSGATAPEYAKLVFDLAMRRELIRLGEEISTDAKDMENESDAIEQIANAEGHLFSLAEVGTVQGGPLVVTDLYQGHQRALLIWIVSYRGCTDLTLSFLRDGHRWVNPRLR